MEQSGIQKENQANNSTPYWRMVTSKLPRHEVSSKIRLTKHGMFIHETLVELTAQAYLEWLNIITESAKDISLEKAKRKLFESDQPDLVYVLDGKQCLPGYIVLKSFSEQASELRELGIQQAIAEPLSTLNYIHPRDPYLEKLDFLKAELRTHEGLVFSINLKNKTFSLNERTLSEFATVVRTSTLIPKLYPKVNGALRDCLIPIRELLLKSRPISKRRQMFVPEKFSSNDINFHRVNNLILATKELSIIGIFELHGKSLYLLIKQEIQKFPSQKPNYSKQNHKSLPTPKELSFFESPPEKSRYFGKISARSLRLLIAPGALLGFIKYLPLTREIRNSPGNFSIKKCLTLLFLELKNSEALDYKTAEAILKHPPKRGAFYRITDFWIFVIEDRNVLSTCIFRRSIKSKNIKTQSRSH